MIMLFTNKFKSLSQITTLLTTISIFDSSMVAMKLLIFKFILAFPLTSICSVQKITDPNGNQAIDGGYEY